MATDELERVGLRLVPIPEETRSKLKEFIDLANSMLRNPIDASPVPVLDVMEFLNSLGNRKWVDLLREKADTGDMGHWSRLNAVLKEWRGLDLVVYQHGFDISPMPVGEWNIAFVVGPMVLAAKACELPSVVVLHSMGNDDTWRASAELRALCAEFGLPLFLSMRGAAVAVRKLIDYYQAYPDRFASIQALS